MSNPGLDKLTPPVRDLRKQEVADDGAVPDTKWTGENSTRAPLKNITPAGQGLFAAGLDDPQAFLKQILARVHEKKDPTGEKALLGFLEAETYHIQIPANKPQMGQPDGPMVPFMQVGAQLEDGITFPEHARGQVEGVITQQLVLRNILPAGSFSFENTGEGKLRLLCKPGQVNVDAAVERIQQISGQYPSYGDRKTGNSR